MWTAPVAVLIGNGTAGPAEIFAAAIADNKRGSTVGERTYGTASQQKLIEMDDGAALILTVANYFTPGNKNIPADGVPPTAEVHPSIDDLLAQADLTQPAALPSSSPDDPVGEESHRTLQGNAADREESRQACVRLATIGRLILHSRGAVRIFAACAAFVLLFLAGCGKKNLSKSELRAITGEIVAAAQKVNGHKSEISIRPEQQPAKHGGSSALAADNIYMSLDDASQAAAFAQALSAIARKHDLSVTETASSGVIRFDCAFHGTRTHTVHVDHAARRARCAFISASAAMPATPAIRTRDSQSSLTIWVTIAPPPMLCSLSAFRLPFPSCRICRFPANSPKKRAAAAIR